MRSLNPAQHLKDPPPHTHTIRFPSHHSQKTHNQRSSISQEPRAQQETGATDTKEHLVETGMPSCSAPPPDASIKAMLSMYGSWPKQKGSVRSIPTPYNSPPCVGLPHHLLNES